jgi:membrane protein YqaA with SNARE-associated domain
LIAYGPWGIFLLGIFDSAGVPIPAALDALLIFISWKSPEHAWMTAVLVTLGSICGNIGLFLAARFGGRRFVKAPEPGGQQRFRNWFARYGLVTVFIPATLPIPLPLKVFVISAGVLHTRFWQFVLVVFLARVIRYFGEAYLGMKLGQDAQGFLARNAWTLAGVALALGFAMYLLIWLNDRRRSEV